MRNGETELVLFDNQITDAGAIKLAEMLPSSKLILIGLDRKQITDVGALQHLKIENKDGKKINIRWN